MKNHYIYGLIDPETNEIRYIGKTNDPKRRLDKHINECFKENTPKGNWICELKDKNLIPSMVILDQTSYDELNKLEKEYIKKYKKIGNLTNVTEGRKHNKDTKEKLKLCHPTRKIVLQFDMENNFIKSYQSCSEAGEVVGFNRKSITNCCKGITKSFNGYYFRFSDNFFPCELAKPITNMEEIQKVLDLDDNKITNSPKIILNNELIIKKLKPKKESKIPQKIYIHYDLEGNILGKYAGISETSRKTFCHPELISKCCKDKTYYTVNNTTFRYDGDKFDYVPYNKSIQKTSKKIYKYTLDGTFVEEFDSIKRACIAAGISENGANISRCCHKKYNEKTGKSIIVKGFTYRFSEDSF